MKGDREEAQFATSLSELQLSCKATTSKEPQTHQVEGRMLESLWSSRSSQGLGTNVPPQTARVPAMAPKEALARKEEC